MFPDETVGMLCILIGQDIRVFMLYGTTGNGKRLSAFLEESSFSDTMANSDDTKLFEPLRIGTANLAHRIVYAPMTT
jgi:hypothetical protein